ncbi:hypothetical protein [Flagellimonas sp.]|uniref:hypothetical protein n=1 Tax=Flagellimonas sp. TaxID=2058762 RepID=UPI003B508FF5
MKKLVLFYAVLALLGCKNEPVSEEQLDNLNGYWEISEVIFPDGSKKNYTINPSIDFIQLENKQGFRKKVRPKFNGTYETSHDVELLKVVEGETFFIFQYSNEFSEWEETLVQLDSMSFSVRNNEGILYSYKRFEPISIPK